MLRYAIVLLTTLNRREDHRDGGADSSRFTDFYMDNLDLSTGVSDSQGFPGSRTTPVLVQIDRTRTVDDATPVSKPRSRNGVHIYSLDLPKGSSSCDQPA